MIYQNVSLKNTTLFLLLCLPSLLQQSCRAVDYITEVNNWLAGIEKEMQKSVKKYSAQWSKELIDYKEGSGLFLDVNSFTVTPATVKRGEVVTINMEYVIVGTGPQKIKVKQTKDLWFNDRKIAELDSDEVDCDDGTWESSTSFKVPDSAQTGKHKIKETLVANDLKVQSLGFFTVTQ